MSVIEVKSENVVILTEEDAKNYRDIDKIEEEFEEYKELFNKCYDTKEEVLDANHSLGEKLTEIKVKFDMWFSQSPDLNAVAHRVFEAEGDKDQDFQNFIDRNSLRILELFILNREERCHE